MQPIERSIEQYIKKCQSQRRLDSKTIKAYRIDLQQFQDYLVQNSIELDKEAISSYLEELNRRFKPRSVKRKLASSKAFCRYLVEENELVEDPFSKLCIRIQEPKVLPRTVPLRIINAMLQAAYDQIGAGGREPKGAIRDAAVMELLFATGIRVSELSGLNISNVDLEEGSIMIWGKGSKERLLQIGNKDVLAIMKQYAEVYCLKGTGPFFLNRLGHRLSEQSVRMILRRYGELIAPTLNITPHMFRHSFATLLLEEDVDIRYIQQMLGHSSISTTQIYTNVSTAKQREILTQKHPRNRLEIR